MPCAPDKVPEYSLKVFISLNGDAWKYGLFICSFGLLLRIFETNFTETSGKCNLLHIIQFGYKISWNLELLHLSFTVSIPDSIARIFCGTVIDYLKCTLTHNIYSSWKEQFPEKILNYLLQATIKWHWMSEHKGYSSNYCVGGGQLFLRGGGDHPPF